MESSQEVLIVGGGIGGLVLACALERRGVPWQLFERAAELRPAGAGMTVQINAMSALRQVGLADAVAAVGQSLAAAVLASERGRILSRSGLTGLVAELGDPMLAVHRASLQQVFLDRLPASRIHLGQALSSFEDTPRGVQARFVGGSEAHGAVLVGADGLRSRVRQGLLGDGEPTYAGYTSWRGVGPEVPGLVLDEAWEYWGRGARFGIVPLGGGQVYWFGVANAPPGERDRDPQAAVLTLFGEWAEPIGRLVAATPQHAVLRTDIHDRPTVSSWSRGRVVLLGDAAHPMTPNLGQGGCMAIEDAVVLGGLLADGTDIGVALGEYQRRRVRRANRVVDDSRRLGRVAQWSGRISTAVRDLGLRLTPERVMLDQVRALARFDA